MVVGPLLLSIILACGLPDGAVKVAAADQTLQPEFVFEGKVTVPETESPSVALVTDGKAATVLVSRVITAPKGVSIRLGEAVVVIGRPDRTWQRNETRIFRTVIVALGDNAIVREFEAPLSANRTEGQPASLNPLLAQHETQVQQGSQRR
jgi:hypothetical protein